MQVPERSLFVDLTTKPTRYVKFDIFLDGNEYVDFNVKYGTEIEVSPSISTGEIETYSSVTDNSYEVTLSLANTSNIDYYNGRYIVVPKSVDQELETKRKKMRDNVLVKEVPTFQVANEKGYTFVIL